MERWTWVRDLPPPGEEAKPSVEQWHREDDMTMNVCVHVNPVLVKERKISENIPGVVGRLQWVRNQLLVNLYAMKAFVSPTHGQPAIPISQLETDHPRPMGLRECAMTQTGADRATSTEDSSRGATPIPRAKSLHAGRVFKASLKRSYHLST